MRRNSASVSTRSLVTLLSFQRWRRARKAWRLGSRSSLSCSTSRSSARICRRSESACGGIMFKRWIKSSMQLMRTECPTNQIYLIFKFPQPHQSLLQPPPFLQAALLFPFWPFPPFPIFDGYCGAQSISNFKNQRMRKQSQELQLLGELQTDHHDIAKLRQQRQVVAKVQSSLVKKDEEIDQLRALLQKYQAYQQKYTSLKVELTERAHLLARKDAECKMLRKQMEDLLKDQAENTDKIKQYESERQTLLRERHQMETAHKEIQSTFKEYQTHFRKRENALAFDLERAYQQIKEANSRIDQLELIAEEKKALQQRLKDQQEKQAQQEQLRNEERQKTPKPQRDTSKQKTNPDSETLMEQIHRLKGELLAKQEELSSHRVLNYELTLEYDSSISGICALQTEVSAYRRENNELKKILSLLREQEKCRQIEQKYTLRNNTHFGTPNSQAEEGEDADSEDDLPTHKPFQSTELPAVHT